MREAEKRTDSLHSKLQLTEEKLQLEPHHKASEAVGLCTRQHTTDITPKWARNDTRNMFLTFSTTSDPHHFPLTLKLRYMDTPCT
jgi:hypothetical protein